MRRHQTPARRRLVLIASTTVIAIAGLGATAAPSMADIRLATTTTVTASPSAVGPSGSTTLTASIRPGFLIGPLGNVKFTDSNNGAALGTVKPGLQCILRAQPCIATAHRPGVGTGGREQHDRRRLLGRHLDEAEQRVDRRVRGNRDQLRARRAERAARARRAATTPPARRSTARRRRQGPRRCRPTSPRRPPPCTTVGYGDTLVYTVTNARQTGPRRSRSP